MAAGEMTGALRTTLAALLLIQTMPLAAQAPARPDNGPAYAAQLATLGLTPQDQRPGVDGNDPQAPNAANFDEAKVAPFSLPALMGLLPPIDARGWAERRAQLVTLVEDNLVGRVPEAAQSVQVIWTTIRTEKKRVGGIPAIVRSLRGATAMPDGRAGPVIEAVLTLPAKRAGQAPVVIDYSFVWPAGVQPPGNGTPAADPAIEALRHGWAYAAYYPYSVQADNGAGLASGIIGLVGRGAVRAPTDWGVLRAWAWGASRLADHLQGDPALDGVRLAIAGLSRFGKSALVAAAFDARFGAALVGSSGAGGAKLLRRNYGEQVENLAGAGTFHWFAPNFLGYAGPRTVADLPIDAHMLIALVAPRPLLIGTGVREQGDGWVDPRGNYLAAVAATPAWTLLGQSGPTSPDMPPVDGGIMTTTLAFRQHSGGHSNAPNWSAFLDWADRMWTRPLP